MTESSVEGKGNNRPPGQGIEPPIERRAETREALRQRAMNAFAQLQRLEPRDSRSEHANRMTLALKALEMLEAAAGVSSEEKVTPPIRATGNETTSPVEAVAVPTPVALELESLPFSERLSRLANKEILMEDPESAKKELDAILSRIDQGLIDDETREDLQYASRKVDRLVGLGKEKRGVPADDAQMYLAKAAKRVSQAEKYQPPSLEKMQEFLDKHPGEKDIVKQVFLNPKGTKESFEKEHYANLHRLGFSGPEGMARMRENTERLTNLDELFRSIRPERNLDLRLENARRAGEILSWYHSKFADL